MRAIHGSWALGLMAALQTAPAQARVGLIPQDSIPTVQEIVERYIDAVGGREAITKLATRVMRGTLITDLPSRTPPRYEESTVEIRSALPGAFLMIAQGPGGTHVDGLDGTIWWSTDGVHVTRHERVDWRFAWFANPQHAVRLWEYFPAMTLRGRARVGGHPAYVVDIDHDESHALYFDVASGLLVRLGYNRELHDYREVDFVKVPFRMVISRKGGSTSYVFHTIEHNVVLDESLFAMPDTSGVDTRR
jgi:hypothetical protein